MTRSVLGKLFVASPFLTLLACLSANPGQSESTDPASSSSDTSQGSSGESTLGGIMTTTEEPESEDSGGTASTGDETTDDATSGTTQVIPPECGDGNHDANEECDNGNANANDAACTLACTVAVCGDGFVEAGKETCDDGVNDGAYGGCMPNCMALAPHCGDLNVQGEEECDDDDPDAGCLKECRHAKSCLELKTSWGPFALTDIYPIYPKDNLQVEAFCEMDADDGGYTFVKFGGDLVNAVAAETKCGEIGMRLLVPRSAAHLAAAVDVAFDADFMPAEGMNPSQLKSSDYLRIFGIYPKMVGASCVGQPLNQSACAEWEASDKQVYWVSMESVLGQPGTNNCEKCSMLYSWDNKEFAGFEVINGNGVGAETTHFLCDVGDKHGVG